MSTLQAVVEKARSDPKYRERFKANPGDVLREAGVALPAGKTVEVVEDRPDEVHLFVGTRSNAPLLNRVLERVQQDAAFRQRLASNPNAAMEEALGKPWPANVKVQVHEPSAERICVLLPRLQQDDQGELSDQELDAVAGGGLLRNIGIAVGGAIYDVFCPNDVRHKNLGDGTCATWTDTSGGTRNVQIQTT